MNADPNARDQMLNDLSSTLTPASETIADPPPAPPVIPDHELIRRIGRGSYGEVWLARTALGTWRAVKIVQRAAFDHDRPYEREFEGIRRFEPISRTHPSQLNVLHVGRNDAAGHFYYVMELADAASAECGMRSSELSSTPHLYTPRTLRSDLYHRGRLPFEECLQIGLALATALDHLHRHGLVHRDIKPSNIIFVNGIPKLADIGLVARAEATLSLVGTEGYLPPEGPGTVQADTYSLGKVLYEMATGRDRQEFPELPTNLISQPAAERAQLAELNEIIVSACHTDLKQRYQTAAELHADLALLQSGKSVSRMRMVERRLQFVARAGALVTGVALLAGGAWLWQQQQTRQARELARQNRQLAEEKTALADEKTKLANNLTKLDSENRNRIVRLNIANGIRLLDDGDPAGALLWFADALPLVTNKPAQESIHRIRIQQTLNQIPRVLQVFPHKNQINASARSDDGQRIVTGTALGDLCVWDTRSGRPLCGPLNFDVDGLWQVRFTHNGKYVFASSLPDHGFVTAYLRPTNTAALINAEAGRPIFSLSGTNLLRADLSPNDRWLVTADTDHVIRVYDALDGKPLAEFKGHTNRILQFAFSDTNVLASCSEDQTIRFWQLPSGNPLGLPIPHQYGPIALSHDGRFLASTKHAVDVETNTIVQVWEVSSGTQVGRPIEMPGQISGLGFRPQRESALFVITLKQCGIFDAETHERKGKIIQCPTGYYRFDVSPGGRLIAFAGKEGFQGVWSFETGEPLAPPCLRDRAVVDFNFTPDALRLLATSDAGTATLLSLKLRREDAAHRFDAALAKEGGANSARFTPDRRFFLLKLKDDSARMVDFERMTERRIPLDSPVGLSPMQFRFDASGRQYATWYSGAGTNVVVLWTEAPRITNHFVLPHPAGLVAPMLFTTDGSRLITSGEDKQVRFWRTADGTLERSVGVPTTKPLTLFPDGRTVFIISAATHRFAFFDLVRGTTTGLDWPPYSIAGFAFSPAGDRFTVTAHEKWSRIWSARTGEPLTPPLDHGGEVGFVDWSPDGTRLITADLTPELKIWDAATGEQSLVPLRLGSKAMETGLWSLDGRFIVGCSDENAVRVWDAATGEPVTPILNHDGNVYLANLVANNRLVTLSLPNIMRAWDLAETRLTVDVIADYAKLVAGRRLNAAGVMLPLKPSELVELSYSLRARAPQLFE